MAMMAHDTCANPIPQPQQTLHSSSSSSHHTAAYGGDRYQYFPKPISKGSYGVVYRAWDRQAEEIVAIKHELYGLHESTKREISILRWLPPHPSIVELKNVMWDKRRGVRVVMEFAPCDLGRLMAARKTHLTLPQLKLMMRQVVGGVAFLHANGVMHRDLKPANILIDQKDRLKICDFGLSRCVCVHAGPYTPGVVTLWYRAPELLLGETNYTYAIDMWSVGCIMAELLLRRVLFPGNSEIQQLGCIHLTVGASLQMSLSVAATGGAPLLTAAGVDLLQRLLELEPTKRINARDALNHAWFQEI